MTVAKFATVAFVASVVLPAALAPLLFVALVGWAALHTEVGA